MTSNEPVSVSSLNRIHSIVRALENAPGIILPLVQDVPASVLKRRPLPGKWSAHEHACHLAVVHKIFFPRLDLMLNDPKAKITPYQPDRDEDADHLLRMDLSRAMEQFVSDRARLVARVTALSPHEWERTAEHPEYARYSVFIMFRHLAMHDLFHGYRIEELMLKRDWD